MSQLKTGQESAYSAASIQELINQRKNKSKTTNMRVREPVQSIPIMIINILVIICCD